MLLLISLFWLKAIKWGGVVTYLAAMYFLLELAVEFTPTNDLPPYPLAAGDLGDEQDEDEDNDDEQGGELAPSHEPEPAPVPTAPVTREPVFA